MITLQHRQEANRLADEYATDKTRSVEHMNGVRAVLAWWVAGKPQGELDENPYRPGTCQWEAWLAGQQDALDTTKSWDTSQSTGSLQLRSTGGQNE